MGENIIGNLLYRYHNHCAIQNLKKNAIKYLPLLLKVT